MKIGTRDSGLLGMKIGFRDHLLRVCTQNSRIQNSGSNMTDQNVKIYLIQIKIHTRGLFMVADYESSLQISKFKMAEPTWRIKI